jgi:hypothetical protein
MTLALPKFIDLAVVGAGPHSLTLVSHLLEKKPILGQKLLVFDSRTWLSQWTDQFAAQEIPHLRSPVVHHPASNPYALREFAQNRPNELFKPYDLPGTKLFEDFCFQLISQWQLTERLYPSKVQQILPISEGKKSRFELILEGGNSIIARRVVLATGGGVPQMPEWVKQINTPYPPERLSHSQSVDLRKLQLSGKTILIIGGGLTTGHLAVGAIKKGARVILISRRNLQERLFDTDPGWLGPKYLTEFSAESNWYERSRLIQQARNGGSMTPLMMWQLKQELKQGTLTLQENCQVSGASWQDNHWLVKCNHGEIVTCDLLWQATGSKFEVKENPLLKEMLIAYPQEIINGLPVLDDCLRLGKKEFFLMGGLAALQIGPVARNLSGARMAARRIVPALIKPSLALS